MIEFEFVEKLIRSMDASSIHSIEIERDGTRIHLAKMAPGASAAPAVSVAAAPAAPPVAAPVASAAPTVDAPTPPPAGAGWVEVTSPMVGTFYRSPSPESPPFVDVGGRIALGDTLCIIEAMKLMNELEAEVEGVVREVLVQNGEPVEYGQVLFRVEPA
jgi:acetyl-CoA carboxylase biotin carboxyl carrier protein